MVFPASPAGPMPGRGAPPERLVIEGCRRWNAVEMRGDSAGWKSAVDLFCGSLGTVTGARALAELAGFVTTLRRCAACPLATRAADAHDLSREEVLIVALVSALQHGDDAAEVLCLDALTCPSRCVEVACAASRLAMTLKAARHVLLPVPRAALENALALSSPSRH